MLSVYRQPCVFPHIQSIVVVSHCMNTFHLLTIHLTWEPVICTDVFTHFTANCVIFDPFYVFFQVIGGEHKQNLDSLLVCWDQVKSGMDEVGTWITGMLSRLDDSHRHFDDAISVESRLNKFKVI